jgi:hypothetical protein
MYRPFCVCGLSLAVMFNILSAMSAVETRVDVRVISKGAKFIGTSMGGAEITIKDADTGQLLALGKTTGSTGDTRKIMQKLLNHHASVATEDAAVFRATLALDEPRRIRVTARGPLAQRQATATATVTQWVVPGKHITGGDALSLALPGFVVDILHPPAHQKFSQPSDTIELNANVTMMCGCPIEPDGLWNANQFEVAAIIKRNGMQVDEVPLQYAGSTSQFTAKLKASVPGAYEITVYAYDPANGNTGVDKTTIVVSAP